MSLIHRWRIPIVTKRAAASGTARQPSKNLWPSLPPTLGLGRWPQPPAGEIERMRPAINAHNLTQAVSLAEAFWRQLKGENNA